MALYDFIIAGGGASGLGLAYQMAASALREKSVLIVDREVKENNDHNWSFWFEGASRLDHLVYRSWDQAEVVSETFTRAFDLSPYQYKLIRSVDYYQAMQDALATMPGFTVKQGRVTEVSDTQDQKGAQVIIDGVPYGAQWAFDSICKPSDFFTGPRRFHYLKHHFKGWEIETPRDSFDPHTVTLYDFRTPQKGALRFFCLLPLSKRRALVRYINFSADLLKPNEYDRAIAEYLETVRQITRYRTESVETGVIPVTDRPIRRKVGEHVMTIGTKGGLVKPATGNGFLRMQNDAASIVESLTSIGHPFQVTRVPLRYRLVDALLLHGIQRQGSRMKGVFIQLFKRNSIQDIFRFFDEQAPASSDVRLLATLPAAPFVNALFHSGAPRAV